MPYARIPFIASHNFPWLTRIALYYAKENPDNLFGALLELLEDCAHVCSLSGFEQVGASYRTLYRIAAAAGMTEEQQADWILLCEAIPLSERHGLHVLRCLEGQREAA